MEHKQCYQLDCIHEPEFSCDCIPSKAFMCSIHIDDHTNIQGCSHSIQSIFTEIDLKRKESTLEILQKELKSINQLKEKSISIFSELFLTLQNQLDNVKQVLDENLQETQTKINKVIAAKRVSEFETDQLLRSLVPQSASLAEKTCLVDASIIKNIDSLNEYAKEINEKIKELNINKPNDLAKNNILGLARQLCGEKLDNKPNQFTSELEKWENTILSLNGDFKNFPKTRESWYFKSGIVSFLSGDIYRALSLFNFVIKLNPNYSDCYLYKGLALLNLNKKEESLECWNYLLQENKNFSFINMIKAKVLSRLDRMEESREACNEFIQNNPERYFANVLKISSLFEENCWNDLEYCSDEVFRLNPNFSWGLIIRGGQEKEIDGLLKYLHKAIEVDEYCYEAHIFIAMELLRQKNYEGCLASFDTSITINPYKIKINLFEKFQV